MRKGKLLIGHIKQSMIYLFNKKNKKKLKSVCQLLIFAQFIYITFTYMTLKKFMRPHTIWSVNMSASDLQKS